ncbi:DUF2357 domain-containing protein [Cytobacillus oceanisediminis]|uniref:DUF2357 domain-containing protein n=1 Tax=Cytobacillus oceanisediminis TaxID=665099 RepID=UPI001C23B561|nr:DUF2357 domain-containing protein [Cytobacillus oceanisediminis]MBU8769533.1 restriction endonuclease-like protein [Cytobacillus oceanisediminis]
MEQLNSGDSYVELFDIRQGWVPFIDAFLTEATEYKLRYSGNHVEVMLQGIPVPFYQSNGSLYATITTPFQSGILKVSINNQNYETYIYPDDRKLTEEQYNHMLNDILEEANVCFQLSGLEKHVSVSERSRNLSWTQWSYIERSFFSLRQIYSRIQKQPFRQIEKLPIIMKREKIQRVEPSTMNWVDKKGYGQNIPINIAAVKAFETINVYENQVLKQQLSDLYQLLRKYEAIKNLRIAKKASKFKTIILFWLNSPFLKDISENQGHYKITQKFRKHPVYRLWYKWFDSLYKHNRKGLGFDYPIALRDTYSLYEIWCYMKVVKVLRESGYIKHLSGLFKSTSDGLFLNLSENHESRIQLSGNCSLYFQRTYQFNSKSFHTYTQRMIPDIVLETENEIIIFDPKYRVPENLGTALGEMHKYKDGIIYRETGSRAVREVFILTPTKGEQADNLRYFREDFYKRYNMGAIQLLPGNNDDEFIKKVRDILQDVIE